MSKLRVMGKAANLAFMKYTGLKLLSMVILLVHLFAPAQAALVDIEESADASTSHCMQKMAQHDEHSGSDCCQQTKVCNDTACNECQSCASVVSLINLHRQLVNPPLAATPLVYVADYLQGLPPQNLYHPPISIL